MNKDQSKQNSKTKYIIGAIICLALILILAFSLFDTLNLLLIGTFGFFTYILLAGLIIFFVFKYFDKSLKWKKSFTILTISYIVLTLFLLHYLFCLSSFDNGFSDALSYPYKNITLCGAVATLFVSPFAFFAKTVGTIIIFLCAIIFLVAICVDKVYYRTYTTQNLPLRNNKNKNVKVKNKSEGSMEISYKALSENQKSPSFISMPLTLNSKIAKIQEENEKELEQSRELYKEHNEIKPQIAVEPIQNVYNEPTLVETPIANPQIFVDDTTFEDNMNQEFSYENSSTYEENPVFELKDNQTVDDIITDNPIVEEKPNIIKEEPKINSTSNFGKPPKQKLDEEIRKVNKTHKPYVRPPLELLTTLTTIPNLNDERYEEKARIIEQKLEEFKINARCIGVTRGPAITRYEFEMPQGVSVNRITQYSNDISMVLEARKAIRIEAPIPGKNAFGVEVPNDKVDTIGLRDLVSSKEFVDDPSPLCFALGKDITNKIGCGNIGKLVHTLIAGSTGSGKSVCMNAILISLLYKASPDDVRIILIDPKFVEFNIYENLPHLLVPQIITEPAQAVNALTWAIEEMERRNRCFGQYYVRSIDEFNSLDEVKNGDEKKMPYIVIMVDELSDLMMSAKKDIEDRILKLAQKARSAGIHMILATQRPSVDVITGTIKANLPSRIAFSLTNYMDSKTILDQGGAEKLLGRGDMLYQPMGVGEPVRLLGPYVSQKEVVNVVNFVKQNNDTDYDEEIQKSIFVQKSVSDMFNFDATSDEYFVQAIRVAIEAGSVSTSFIQRKFGIGFQRASKLIDNMESLGYITPSTGSNKARKVLITEEEFYEKYGGN